MYNRSRETEKFLTENARKQARAHYEDIGRVESEHIHIPEHAHVHLVDDGAFVDAIIWLPLEVIEKP